MGIIQNGTENIARTRLIDHKKIYLTNPDYYTSDPLPQEWLQVFEETQSHYASLLGKSDFSNNSTLFSLNSFDRKF